MSEANNSPIYSDSSERRRSDAQSHVQRSIQVSTTGHNAQSQGIGRPATVSATQRVYWNLP